MSLELSVVSLMLPLLSCLEVMLLLAGDIYCSMMAGTALVFASFSLELVEILLKFSPFRYFFPSSFAVAIQSN
jgi:hypothetical protein